MALLERRPGQGHDGAGVAEDIARIEAIWAEARERWGAAEGGPFLFGHFTIADAMYLPVATRFRTYRPKLTPVSEAYWRRCSPTPTFSPGKRRPRADPPPEPLDRLTRRDRDVDSARTTAVLAVACTDGDGARVLAPRPALADNDPNRDVGCVAQRIGVTEAQFRTCFLPVRPDPGHDPSGATQRANKAKLLPCLQAANPSSPTMRSTGRWMPAARKGRTAADDWVRLNVSQDTLYVHSLS